MIIEKSSRARVPTLIEALYFYEKPNKTNF